MSELEEKRRVGGLDKIWGRSCTREKGKWRVAHFSGIIINRVPISRASCEKWGLFAAMRLRYRRVSAESDVLVVCPHLGRWILGAICVRRGPELYRPVLQLQSISGQNLVGLRVSWIRNAAPEIKDRGIAIGERCVWVSLYSLPGRLGNGRGEQRWIDHHTLSLKEARPTHTQRRRHMPPPLHMTIGIILCMDVQAALNPHLLRR